MSLSVALSLNNLCGKERSASLLSSVAFIYIILQPSTYHLHPSQTPTSFNLTSPGEPPQLIYHVLRGSISQTLVLGFFYCPRGKELH